MKFDLNNLVRENIKRLRPYSSARHEFVGEAAIFLDANENSLGSPAGPGYNRYPDPTQWLLKLQLEKIKGVPAVNTFIGNGSDEVIDLAYRIFCEPGKDNVIICPPTYGMYEVSAEINNIEVRKAILKPDFNLDVDSILNLTDSNSKLLFICSPNNPTGNSMQRLDIEFLLNNFSGLVIIDEAYINFSRQRSFIQELTEYPNLLVMQTLSKAWGLAGLRLGLAFASEAVLDLFNKVKPPYNINAASQKIALEALKRTDQVNDWIRELTAERENLEKQFSKMKFTKSIYPSDANFLLTKVNDANVLYKYLTGQGIVVRNRTNEILCDNCLRITVGTPDENKKLIEALRNYEHE